MTNLSGVQPGDTIAVTHKGLVRQVDLPNELVLIDGFGWISAYRATVEVEKQPLRVGDVITAENRHLLPASYILADRTGGAWNFLPVFFDENTPFRLVYIHNSTNNEEN